jgi:hypothetical protein
MPREKPVSVRQRSPSTLIEQSTRDFLVRQHKARNPYNHYEGWTNVFIMHRASRRRNQSAWMLEEVQTNPGAQPVVFVDSNSGILSN